MLEWLFGKNRQEESEVKKKLHKKRRSKVEEQAEDKWMYEFVVQFLNSPIWRVTLLDFVDQKCIIFDSEQENKFQYTTIHHDFKKLVGNLFDGMMQEVGLTDQKLAEIIEKGFLSKEKKLFHQLLLCDDFLKFKSLMVRRNKTLENEALNSLNNSEIRRPSKIQKERDMIRESQIIEEARRRKVEDQEEEILKKVLEISKKQAQEKQAIEQLQIQAAEKQIQKIEEQEKITESKLDSKKKQHEQTKQTSKSTEIEEKNENSKEHGSENQEKELQEQKEESQQLEFATKSKAKKKLAPIGGSKLKDLPPLKNSQPKVNDDPLPEVSHEKENIEMNNQDKQIKKEPTIENKQDRKKRLQEQREKIKKQKEEERKKMMEEEFQKPPIRNIVLQDDGIHESTYPTIEEPEQKLSSEEIKKRKEIMNKIKRRIVDDF